MKPAEILAHKAAIDDAQKKIADAAAPADVREKSTAQLDAALEALQKWRATASVLKSTQIGMLVNGLRKNQHLAGPTLKLAQAVVGQWRRDVAEAAAAAKPSDAKPSDAKPNSKKRSADSTETSPDAKRARPATTEKPADAKPASKKRSADSSAPTEKPLDTKRARVEEGPVSAEYASERTAEGDSVDCERTDNRMRNNCIRMLYKGLASFTTEDSAAVLRKVLAIEDAVFAANGSAVGEPYKARVRSMYLNLMDKLNPTLRHRIFDGELSEARFAVMTKEEMASDEVKRKSARAQKDNLAKAIAATNNEAETDMFKCGKCGQRKTRYYQMQTRSADEPMTTFVTCLNCGNRWKFC